MVMPLWDDNPFTKPVKPWVTWGIIALNIVVFMVQAGLGTDGEEAIIRAYALIPVAISHQNTLVGIIPADLPLVTYMFLHADIFHLLGNMIFLFVFGDDIEEAMGALRFIVFYFLCGIAGALAFTLSDPQSSVPLVGASAAISGIIAAYLLLRPCAKIRVLLSYFVVKLSAFWVIGGWAILQLFQLASQSDDGVAYWGHIGGLIAGAALFPLMRRPGVELFECIEPREAPTDGQAMPDSSGLPGAPREPTVR
jgi:membrane associated rhomboid family serine protease